MPKARTMLIRIFTSPCWTFCGGTFFLSTRRGRSGRCGSTTASSRGRNTLLQQSWQRMYTVTKHTQNKASYSALHPSGVAKSSTSFGWGKGWNFTSAGWQVTLWSPIWHVNSSSGVATSVSKLLYPCYFTYSTYLLLNITFTLVQ